MTSFLNGLIESLGTHQLTVAITLAAGLWMNAPIAATAQTGHIYQPPIYVPHSPAPIYQPPIQIPQPPRIPHQSMSHDYGRDQLMQQHMLRQSQYATQDRRMVQDLQQQQHSMVMQQRMNGHFDSQSYQQRMVRAQVAQGQRQMAMLANNPKLIERQQQIRMQAQTITARAVANGGPSPSDLVQMRALQRHWDRAMRLAVRGTW